MATDPPQERVTLKQFLEDVPPGQPALLDEASLEEKVSPGSNSHYLEYRVPLLSLYCGHSSCDRAQIFEVVADYGLTVVRDFQFLHFTCRNCGETQRSYALATSGGRGGNRSQVYIRKLGEIPSFGPPLSSKLLNLSGDHVDWLKKGRRSENQGLGIGAFAYYRRVVEEQKSRLIDEIKKAIERIGGRNEQALESLEAARAEKKFSTALEIMAEVTPSELYVRGQNPFRLLHGPLSEGLHGLSDEDCLKKAHSIRVVIEALLERTQAITADQTELDAAIRELLNG